MDYHLYFFVICFCIFVRTISTALSDRTYFPVAFLTTVCKFVEQMLCQSRYQLRNICKLECISLCSVVCVFDVRCARPVNAHSAHMSTFSVIKFDFISNLPYGNLIYASHQALNRLPSQYPYTNIAIVLWQLRSFSETHTHTDIYSTAWNTKVRFRRFIWQCFGVCSAHCTAKEPWHGVPTEKPKYTYFHGFQIESL